jgi:dTDP-4-dehydrorhamnose reductase
MSRVLVTGASGLLGGALCPRLRAAGWEVQTHSRRSATDFGGDLADGAATAAMVAQAAPDAVVHLAALADVDACERDPAAAWRANVLAVSALAAACTAGGRRVPLVVASTDQVYDGQGAQGEDAVAPRNVYALTKLAGELAAAPAGATVLRLNFFGPSAVPGRPSFSDWLAGAFAARRPITLFTDVLFSPLHLDSVCAAVIAVLARPRAGVYNLGSRDGMSKRDFAHRVAAALGLSAEAARDGTRADVTLAARRPGDMRMDVSRFSAAWDFPLPTLAEEIARLQPARFQTERPPA